MQWILENRLAVKTGDITHEKVDAVVNAANSSLLGGGGVDGAIHRAGGPEILRECRALRDSEYPDGLPAGSAVLTGAGRLPCRYVIHTVGPVWHGGENNEDELLGRAYRSCLAIAREQGLACLAFPAVSTGIYGFPRQRAAKIVYGTISAFWKQNPLPQTVYLVFFSGRDAEVFLTSYKER